MGDHRRIAIAHKDYDVQGGGEVFCRRLAEWLDCPLYVGRRDKANEPDDAALDIHEIPLRRPEPWMIDRGGVTRSVAYMLAWQRAAADLAEYDLVITSGNEPMWYVPPDDQAVLAYTHSTPRLMYDLYPDRVKNMSRAGMLFYTAQRTLYQHNTPRPDLWVANSDRVARRIARYHHVPRGDIRVVYPPVDVHNYDPDAVPTGDYYLHVGRLASWKRVDEIVEAFNHLEQPLKIAGTGPEESRLRAQAGDNIEFLGYVDEDRKRELMAAAKAHVYTPENEDFGMVPIESMAAGTPVIGVAEGFTEFQIQDGRNGLLFDRGVSNLYRAVRRFEREGVEWSPRKIAGFARQFGVQQFRDSMAAAIEEAHERAAITPRFEREREVVVT